MSLTVIGTTGSGIVVPTELIADQVIEEARPFNVVAPLVYQGQLGSGQGKVWEIEQLSTVTAASVTEGSDITATQRTTTSYNATVAEVGASTQLSNLVMETAKVAGDPATWAAAHGRAIGQQITSDMCDLFADLNSSTAVGTSGTNISVAHFIEAIYTLDAANAPGQKRCVLHPRQQADLFNAISSSTGTPFSGMPELVREGKLPSGQPQAGFVGMLFGVPVYQTTEVSAVNSAADRCGAMFVPEAMAFVQFLPRVVKVELERDASQRATEVVTTAVYGVTELIDGYGVPIETDA